MMSSIKDENPQTVAAAINDIEEGKKEPEPVDNSSGASANICCCDTRIASITWFSISLISETVGLISLFENWAIWWVIIIDIVFLILTIVGLVGCAMVKKSMAQAGQVGYIIKAVLCAIGIIVFIVYWATIADLFSDNYIDADARAFINGILAGTLVVVILYFVFVVVGAVVVGKFIKEIDDGLFSTE